jgi:alkylation response protein AidB-like acyl-CoA dehydrogenase
MAMDMSLLADSDGAVLDGVSDLVPWMQAQAGARDDTATFPAAEIAALQEVGALRIRLPIEAGGNPDGLRADRLACLHVRLGQGNLSIGRIVEAHINARHLIARYGTPGQREAANRAVAAGALYALWVTDGPSDELRMQAAPDGFTLLGRKLFCSGAGYATHALVTAIDADGLRRMLVVSLGQGECVMPLDAPLQGMRAAVTGAVDFTGFHVTADAVLGEAGDYLREPDFSAGAWRGSAVALGGLRALLDEAVRQLDGADRLGSPHQLDRLGNAFIALETSRLWVGRAARIAEGGCADPAQVVAYVGLARIAVETACLDAMRLVQRSLGLSAFRRGNPIERLCRDLGTYLRQPAPDQVLTEAAAHFARHPWPEAGDRW